MGGTNVGDACAESLTATRARPPRVVVAEDDDDIRQLLTVVLREFGYDVVQARSGAELLEELGDGLLLGDVRRRPDIIISDVLMPGFTGLEIFAGLRDEQWPTALVLMTAYADAETRSEALRLGVDAFLEKPFEIDDLLTLVVNLAPFTGVQSSTQWH